jgi:Right handed beta helix region
MQFNLRVVTFVFILILCLPWRAVQAGSPFTVVYPTGVYPDDVTHVQEAVSAGGEVVLEASDRRGRPTAFNFGPAVIGPGAVTLPVDVNLHGTTSDGQMTTITGGYSPINVFSPIRVRIQGLRFIGPLATAITVLASTDAIISDNVVKDVGGLDDGSGTTFAWGIAVNTIRAQFSNISGRLLIARNEIDGVHAQAAYGIEVSNLDADVTIDGNRVTRVNLNGILVGVISRHALIVNNTVIPGPAQDPDFTSGNGIFVGHARGGHFSIRSNRVICDNPFADGIAIISSPSNPVTGSEVVGNDVTMHGSFFGGISLYDTVSEVFVADNEIRGDGAYALQIGLAALDLPASAVGNTFKANAVDRFTQTVGDVFLDINAADTVLCDQRGTVVDNGSDTQIVSYCAAPVR